MRRWWRWSWRRLRQWPLWRRLWRWLKALARRIWRRSSNRRCGRRRPLAVQPIRCVLQCPKPRWVIDEVLRLKALMPDSGCRTLATCFNRRFACRSMTVGKTFVSQTIRAHQYEIQVLRRRIKQAPPKPVAFQRIWGIDLTGKTDDHSRQHGVLAIVEHHSRACLTLLALEHRTTITVLRHLLDAIERYGAPKIVRTDNEAIFTSSLFRFCTWLLGVRHQRTELHCPWQNGRVERFFGTLKEKLAYFAPCRSLISRHAGHRFHGMPVGHFT